VTWGSVGGVVVEPPITRRLPCLPDPVTARSGPHRRGRNHRRSQAETPKAPRWTGSCIALVSVTNQCLRFPRGALSETSSHIKELFIT